MGSAAVAAVYTPGYSSVEETVSQLMDAGAPAGALARGGIVLYSLLLIPLAIALGRRLPLTSAVRRFATAGVWAHIMAGIIAGVFANDSPQVVAAGVTVNDVHDAAGYVMYGAAMVATGAVGLPIGQNWSGLVSKLSAAVFVTMFVCGIGLAWNLAPGLAGLEERIGLGAFLAWLMVISTTAAIRSRDD